MNNKKRASLRNAITYVNLAASIVERVRDDEQDAFDNAPENFQDTDRYQKMEDAAEALDDALESFEDAVKSIEEAIA